MSAALDAHRLLNKALEVLGDTPQPLLEAAADAAKYAKVSPKALTRPILAAALGSADLNDPIQLSLSRAISRWDYVEKADWTAGTLRNTPDRRSLALLCQRLVSRKPKRIDRLRW